MNFQIAICYSLSQRERVRVRERIRGFILETISESHSEFRKRETLKAHATSVQTSIQPEGAEI
jgi:hypothetical protein